jgi:hypothetical protein
MPSPQVLQALIGILKKIETPSTSDVIPHGGGTKPVPRTAHGSGPDSMSSSGGIPFDPLEDAVRSKEVLDGSTESIFTGPVDDRKVKKEFGKGSTTKPKTSNAGIEQRMRELAAGGEVDPMTGETVVVPKSELENAAITARDAASQEARDAYNAVAKRVKGKDGVVQRLDKYDRPVKPSQGNDIESDALRGDFTLQELENTELQSLMQSRPKGEGPKGTITPTTKPVTKLPEAAQVDTLGLSSDEQILKNEIDRVKAAADKATQTGANNVPERIKATARQFGNKQEINAIIQDLYNRLDETFPGFKNDSVVHDAFFETPSRTKGGLKQGSAASRLNDTKKELGKISSALREGNLSPDKQAAYMKRLTEIDNEFFGTNLTIEDLNPFQRNPEVDPLDLPMSFPKDAAPRKVGKSRSDVNELGPKRTLDEKTLREMSARKPSGFKPSGRSAPPVEGTLSAEDTMLNILRDIKEGNLGPIGQ